MLVLLLAACATDEVAWAINHATVTPTAAGFSGTQTWEFFSGGWTPDSGDEHYVCARVQTLTGEVAGSPECAACTFLYAVTAEELDGDCAEDVATDPSYTSVVRYGVGEVDADFVEDDPHPDQALGWYISVDNRSMEPFGWAWDAALDYDGDPGPPGWNSGQTYTLWPGVAWEL